MKFFVALLFMLWSWSLSAQTPLLGCATFNAGAGTPLKGGTPANGCAAVPAGPSVAKSSNCAIEPCAYTASKVGNQIAVMVWNNGSDGNYGCPISSTTTFTSRQSYASGGFAYARICTATATSTSADSYTKNNFDCNGAGCPLLIVEVTNTSGLESVNSVAFSQGGTVSSSSITTTNANDLLLGWEIYEYGSTQMVMSSSTSTLWSLVVGVGIGTGPFFRPYNFVSAPAPATGSYNQTWTNNNSAQSRGYGSGILAFKP